jgi:Putative beta-lactamase-inhibitor-like, PepSY-like
MKAKNILLAVLFLSVAAFAQESKVPKIVKDAFAKIHPAAATIIWEKEGANSYEISFKENGIEISVVMDGKGALKETETAIPIAELPASIAPYIEKKYAGYTINDGAKIVNDKGVTTFEAGISKGKIKKDVMFDKDGAPLKKK